MADGLDAIEAEAKNPPSFVLLRPGAALALVAELRRLRAERDALAELAQDGIDESVRLRYVIERVAELCDDNRTEDAYHVLHDAIEGWEADQ